jgi:hypothetical protein
MKNMAEPIKSKGPLRANHPGIACVKRMKSTTGSKIVLYFFKSKIIENNKFKNKIKVGLMTGMSHNANPQ